MSSAKVTQILNNNNWQYSQFGKLSTLTIGEDPCLGMGGDYVNYIIPPSYTVPAGHRLISFRKTVFTYPLWAEGATGDYQYLNGAWYESIGGAGVTYPRYMKPMPGYGYASSYHNAELYSLNGVGNVDDTPIDYGFCWALVRGDYNSEEEIFGGLYADATGAITIAHKKYSQANFTTLTLDRPTHYNLPNENSTPPTFRKYSYYNDSRVVTVSDSFGNNAYINGEVVSEFVMKEEFDAGETITKANGSPGYVTMDVLLIDSKGKPVEFQQPRGS